VIVVVGSVVAFATYAGAPAILIVLPALCLLARQRTAWRAFAVGFTADFIICAALLTFIFNIFGAFAVILWLIGALPFAIFLCLLNQAHKRLGATWAMCLTPVLWTGIEYFRSELWYLRFAWLLPGQAPAFLPGVRFNAIGVYGLGFVYVTLAALAIGPSKRIRIVGITGLALAAIAMFYPPLPASPTTATLNVAGIQTERWDVPSIVEALEHLAATHQDAQLLVLSELAFHGPVPPEVRDVVRKHHRYLIAGGTAPIEGGGMYNTAFVIGPDGDDIFSQAKSVPVQFMSDGTPAPERHVWNSPWGEIGIAICYDASYTRVMDDFVREGARGLIIPTMDVASWGEFERRMLHGRVQPVRSAEYGIPTFGVWSSGVSQLTDRFGRIIATTSYPGLGDTITGPFDLSRPGRIPPDRPLAIACVVGTAAFLCFLIIAPWVAKNR
jgi:apolipoprotein N-acyltransferase